jgi:polyisoprenyl-teichoic acid--peptidoglycan teichoic acid transferase
MAAGEKPYRVYRGGRVKGKVPLQTRPGRDGGADTGRPKEPRERRRPRRAWSWRRRILVALVGLILLFLVWCVASYFSFRSGVSSANARVDPATAAALSHQSGLLISHPTTILLLGTDHSQLAARSSDHHSDSIMLVRTDPSRHRISYLSVPRDLQVAIPGHGDGKINAAMQIGGPPLAIKTIEAFTGLKVDHIVVVDFGSFKSLIDQLGGVTVNNPRPILSDRFDCPYATQARCQRWQGWRFAKGRIHLNGQLALIYSRVRVNRLAPGESDVTRGERQQAVLQAIASQLASVGTFVKLPFIGGDLMKPLTTDLSAAQLLELGWVKFRSSSGSTLHCRLGGDAGSYGGASVISPSEQNGAVIQMVLGNSAPQPPAPGSGPFGPGCVVGSQTFR